MPELNKSPITTQPIPRIASSESEVLYRNYRAQGRPVIITQGAAGWRACSWTFEALRQQIGDVRVRASLDLPQSPVPYDYPAREHERDLTVAEFLEHLDSAPARASYIHQVPLREFAGLVDDVDFQSLLRPEDGAPLVESLWLGSAETHSGLHFDGEDNFFAQVVGSKRVFMVPASESRFVHPYLADFGKSPIDVEGVLAGRVDLAPYPRFSRATVYEATLQPGDVLFMPAMWWHHLHALTPSISVSHHRGETFALSAYFRILGSLGPRYWYTVARQFFVQGVFGRPSERPLYSQPGPGKLLYDYVRLRLQHATSRSGRPWWSQEEPGAGSGSGPGAGDVSR
jgi:hypothetical protein